jgi:hypothetical protein
VLAPANRGDRKGLYRPRWKSEIGPKSHNYWARMQILRQQGVGRHTPPALHILARDTRVGTVGDWRSSRFPIDLDAQT